MAHFIYLQAENILTKLKDCPTYQNRIEYTMLSLKAILLDAEKKQEQNQYLHDWLKELQNVFYQIEDSIDEFKWEFFKQEGTRKQVCAHFSCSAQISANKLRQTRKMEKLCDQLNAITARMYEFHLKEKHIASLSMETTHPFLSATEISIRHMKPSWQLLYPLTDAPRDDDFAEQYNQRYKDLLSDFNGSTHRFFHIVGEAGMGKSTLAKFLYNHKSVIEKYTSRYWVCVEEGFDTQRLMKEVYNHADNKEICEELTMKQLLSKVRRSLKERTFLLIFQDLSITNLGDCDILKNILEMGNHDSKIIVTTQSEEIAKALKLERVYRWPMTEKQSKQKLVANDGESVGNSSIAVDAQNQAVPGPHDTGPIRFSYDLRFHPSIPQNEQDVMTYQTIYTLERLSEENSILLFKHYAFKDGQEAEKTEITEIAKQIVQKCKGVPLAIKCLGNLLSSKTRIAEWQNVENKLRSLQEKDDSILPILRLCYNQMPSQLKPCFLLCSQLPNDRILSSNDMIQLWMAHGLLHSPEEINLSMENIGEKYFMELWSRCFIQEIEEHGLGYWVKVHPLIIKLAHVLTQEQSEGSEGTKPPKPFTEIRSIAFQVRNMVLPNASLPEKCISKFKCLRLLYLGNANLQEIPNSIGTLKNLRYLDLHGNQKIKQLPNAICDLLSLQTLILESCSSLEGLPKDIRNLISLRYLWVTTNKLHLHKNGVGTMSSLRFLAIGGCHNLQNLFEQPDCLAGLETLMIYDCNTLKLLPNEMRFLKSLQNLMIWSCKQLTLTLEAVEFRLQRFTIKELPKVEELPRWLEGSAETLRSLQIINCPIRMGGMFVSLNAVERIIIYGAVRFEMTAPGYCFEHRNFVIGGGASEKMKYYC
ncbi:disease resistance protein RGA2-like [Benincasa hispida]|uniref:disease resistance protein RGA2-like n=1 Tax=Benincasa hispida TaxID=102211 RepID=UPI0018FF23A9|nr:disease resistance protein RGA2-like [Benincasa hispida]